MKAIKINPYDETITEVNLPEPHDYTEIYKQLGYGCDTFTIIDLGNRETMFMDDEGLLKVKADESDLTRFFVLLDGAGRPLHLVAGCGLVLGTDYNGNSIETKMTLAEIRKLIRFISASNGIKVTKIVNELLDIGGFCLNYDELIEYQNKHHNLMDEVLKLTRL